MTNWLLNTSTETEFEPRLRIFCFPYAGGGASIYRAWQTAVAPDIEICPVQLPGRENRLRERPYTELARLIPELTESLLNYLDRPFAIYGHSMGALIAFEWARYLRREYWLNPVQLYLSACRSPETINRNPPIHRLPDKDFLDQMLYRYNGIPKTILANPDIMGLFLPLLRADLAIVETYVYQEGEPIPCPISIFGGTQDKIANQNDLEDWQAYTSQTFRLRMFEGDHFFLKTAQSLLLEALEKDLGAYCV